jgi:hypothetical protein
VLEPFQDTRLQALIEALKNAQTPEEAHTTARELREHLKQEHQNAKDRMRPYIKRLFTDSEAA